MGGYDNVHDYIFKVFFFFGKKKQIIVIGERKKVS